MTLPINNLFVKEVRSNIIRIENSIRKILSQISLCPIWINKNKLLFINLNIFFDKIDNLRFN